VLYTGKNGESWMSERKKRGFLGGLKKKVKVLGEKSSADNIHEIDTSFPDSTDMSVTSSKQAGMFSGWKDELKTKVKVIGDTTSAVGLRAKGLASQKRTEEATKNLLDVVTKVAREARNSLDPDMVKAIDLRANISFVAFSVGVVVDLEKLQPKKIVVT
jgi:hypothetical protein